MLLASITKQSGAVRSWLRASRLATLFFLPRPPLSSSDDMSSLEDRPIPYGWIKEYDNNYKQFFYVRIYALVCR